MPYGIANEKELTLTFFMLPIQIVTGLVASGTSVVTEKHV
jgi:hypothetical protein